MSGHPIVAWPGWVVNPARNNGADIQPLPVQPLHYGNFAATQMQLKNGLELSTFGHRDSYDNYLRLLSASNASTSKGMKQILPAFHPAAVAQPSTVQQQQMIQTGAPNPNPTGGTGEIAPGVNLANRRFYG